MHAGRLIPAVLAASLLITGCGASAGGSGMKIFYSGNGTFDDAVFRSIDASADKDKSFIFSPYSIKDAITLMYGGMNKGAKEELKKLGITDRDVEDIEADDRFFASTDGLDIANRAFVNGAFKNTLKTDLIRKDGMEYIDTGRIPESVKKINGWVSDNTGGKITDLLSEDSISENTAVVLANAIYMKMGWENESSYRENKNTGIRWESTGKSYKSFYGDLDIEDIKEDDGAVIVKLPYDSDRTSLNMYFIIPKDKDKSIYSWIKNGHDYGSLLDFSKSKGPKGYDDAEFEVPDFETRYRPDDMIGLLKKAGLDEKFTDTPTVRYHTYDALINKKAGAGSIEGLYISDIEHEAYIKTDIKGTEATAATDVIANDNSAAALPAEHKTYHFYCNRPFAAVIKEERSGQILFMGRITDDALEEVEK